MAQFKLCWQSEAAILPFRLTTDLRLACCVIKMRENSLFGSANLFKGVNVIDIRTKWFGNFPRFELSRVNLSHGSQNWFELSGVSRNRGFEKSGGKIVELEWSKSKGNKVWFEISTGNRGFEKSGFHCTNQPQNSRIPRYLWVRGIWKERPKSTWPTHVFTCSGVTSYHMSQLRCQFTSRDHS